MVNKIACREFICTEYIKKNILFQYIWTFKTNSLAIDLEKKYQRKR